MKAESFTIKNTHPPETDTFWIAVKAIKYNLVLLLNNHYRGLFLLVSAVFAVQELHETGTQSPPPN